MDVNPDKIEQTKQELLELALSESGSVSSFCADLSKLSNIYQLAEAVAAQTNHLDVIIHNAGILHAAEPRTADGLDIRFVVNAIAPMVLTAQLSARLIPGSRVVNVSSAAQQSVNLNALTGKAAP